MIFSQTYFSQTCLLKNRKFLPVSVSLITELSWVAEQGDRVGLHGRLDLTMIELLCIMSYIDRVEANSCLRTTRRITALMKNWGESCPREERVMCSGLGHRAGRAYA